MTNKEYIKRFHYWGEDSKADALAESIMLGDIEITLKMYKDYIYDNCIFG